MMLIKSSLKIFRYVIYICVIICIYLIINGAMRMKLESGVWVNNIDSTLDQSSGWLSSLFQNEISSQMKSVSAWIGINIRFLIFLSNFNNLMASLKIKGALIESSVLYRTLDPDYKHLLEKRKFDVSSFNDSKNIVTYGILEEDIWKLQKEYSINILQHWGLRPYFVQTPAADWMLASGRWKSNDTYTSHAFFKHHEFTIHAVVFHYRNNYMWHGALEPNLDFLSETDLQFVNHPAAFEKFTFEPLWINTIGLHHFHVPSNPHHFLFQISSSRFLECNNTRSGLVFYPENLPKDHGETSTKEFEKRTVTALRNLKILLHPLLMNFWIFAGTMLGWHRDCGVIPFTSDVDFAAWAHELEDIDPILAHGRKNKNFPLIMRMGLPQEALELRFSTHSVNTDLFFLYQISNGSWGSGHRPGKGYYFRYYYPHFTLCSAELLGEKVQVPCETEDVIVAEYGPNWMTPVSSWYYESSIKNRGPNIYWDDATRKKTYEEY